MIGGCGLHVHTHTPRPGFIDGSGDVGIDPFGDATDTVGIGPPPARGTLVTTADSQFGEILFDDSGQAIYLFDKEQTTSPELL